MSIQTLPTPCLLLDTSKMERNIDSLRRRLHGLGVPLRPHVKTAKCVPVIARALEGQPGGITVSTLKEAAQFFQAGIRDILCAVSIVPAKLEAVALLRKRGADVSVVLDSMEAAEAVAAAGIRFGIDIPALIEVDCDGHRAGIRPGDPSLLRIGRVLAPVPARSLGAS